MSTAVEPYATAQNDKSAPAGSLALLAETWSQGQIALIRRTIAPNATYDELGLFAMVCQRTGLDPFTKQIYGIKRGDKFTIQTGIDGYRLLAARTGELAGIDDAVYDSDDAEHPTWARVTVYRLIAGQRVPFTATARWREYKPERGAAMWDKMPYLMLGKCAEALALRKAFPAEISGVYTAEEMSQADSETVPYIEATPAASEPDNEFTRLKAQIKAQRRGQKLTWAALRQRAMTLNYATQDQWEGVCVEATGKEDSKTYTAIDMHRVADYLDGQEAKAALMSRTVDADDGHDLHELGTVRG